MSYHEDFEAQYKREKLRKKTDELRENSKLPSDETERILAVYNRASNANIELGLDNRKRTRDASPARKRKNSTSFFSDLWSFLFGRD